MNLKTQEFYKEIRKLLFKPKKRLEFFQSLSVTEQASALMRFPKKVRKEIVNHILEENLLQVLEHLDPDQATDIIRLLPKHKQQHIIRDLDEHIKQDVSQLLQFDPDTAAGLMSLDYIQVDENETIAQAAHQFKIHEQRTGRPPVIVVMSFGKFLGILPGYGLGIHHTGDKVGQHLKKAPTVGPELSKKEVVKLFRDHPHDKLLVKSDDESVLGVIYSDDVLRMLHEQESASLYDFAGVHDEESVLDSTLSKVKFRYKWLIINLGTAFLAAFTVGLFEDIIAAYVLLAVYMPIVAGMGGNAGTQTLAIVVRGLAMHEINLKTSLPLIWREIKAGFINGLINGVLVAVVVMLFNNDPAIAFILFSAMIINLVVAGFFGALIPLIMQKLGKDPASSATIFITTATDVLGFLAFLGLATVILS